MPCTGEASTALEFSADRNAGHRRACTDIMHPGGERRSAYNGASQDLNSRLRLVAQMSSPRMRLEAARAAALSASGWSEFNCFHAEVG